jgi:ATP-dependent helicase/nuclease subunit A
MNKPFDVDSVTLNAQRKASDPKVSAWVLANAGSGKTFVLAQRVKRLLLCGIKPEKILCLTYTKAAAANMANRILGDLAAWVRMPKKDLQATLAALEGCPSQRITEKDIDQARRLFALALETPGGLKIQTIHAFCDALLHQFPFEAGVAAGFQILSDVEQNAMIAKAFEKVLLSPEGAELQGYVSSLLCEKTPEELRGHVKTCCERFGSYFRAHEDIKAHIYAGLGIDAALTEDVLAKQILGEGSLAYALWPDLVAALVQTGDERDKKHAALFERALASKGINRARDYLQIFLNEKAMMRSPSAFPSAAFKKAWPQFTLLLHGELARLSPLQQQLSLIDIAQDTRALFQIAKAVWLEIEAIKTAKGLLSFSDMIERADSLLNSESAPWVRYKLDQGVDHVLIDEAQDTSAMQWRVITGLVQEFFAGKGARENLRTVFAVGDDKQSIFSFQGANRELFDIERKRIAKASKDAQLGFEEVSLHLSFRSSSAILQAVDQVFASAEAAKDVTSGESFPPHQAAKHSLPGFVEVWPPEMPHAKDDITAFDHPFSASISNSPRARLAERIAAEVLCAVNAGECRAGDVLILVRTRNSLFETLLKELKKAGLPVAGADRLVLNDHIAVMDLMALGDAVLLPEDDLNFAALLKSPLFNFSENDLFELVHARGLPLVQALDRRAHERPNWQQAYSRFLVWKDDAQNHRPYEFFARVLGKDGGRSAFHARLGAEAGEVLDEFLNAALAFEASAIPTLQNFQKFMRDTRSEIKREMQQGQNEVRVMTVHNAKGLEAKWVILADTLDKPGKAQLDSFYELHTGAGQALIWAPGEKNRFGIISQAKDRMQNNQEGEYRRLLYVALTRAEQRLTICGASGKDKIADNSWHYFVHQALTPLSAKEVDAEGKIRRWVIKTGDSLSQTPLPEKAPHKERTESPAWQFTAPREPAIPFILRPSLLSDQGIEAVDSSEDNLNSALARERGILLHRLFEYLPRIPQEKRAEAAKNFLEKKAPHFSLESRAGLAAEAINVLAMPHMQIFFNKDAMAEMALNATINLPDGRIVIVQGQTDRVALTPEALHIVDFKSGKAPARQQIPEAYLSQLSLYREALKPLAGSRRLRSYLLWTSIARLDEIDSQTLDRALAKIA